MVILQVLFSEHTERPSQKQVSSPAIGEKKLSTSYPYFILLCVILLCTRLSDCEHFEKKFQPNGHVTNALGAHTAKKSNCNVT